MHLASLTVSDFRNIVEITIEPDPLGTTVITGRNGSGKTSVLEAIAYLATLQSFRSTSKESMIRVGSERAILRAETMVEGRAMSIEAELAASGRSRTMVNRQSVRRRHDLHQALRTTVFSPDDIGVVRQGPGERRRFLDETLAVVDARASRDAEEVDKILRQRTALLRAAGRRIDRETATTLDVWDARLDVAGTALVEAREALVTQLAPLTGAHYSRLAGETTEIRLDYCRSWSGRLLDALVESRSRDLDRGMSVTGPHRDDLALSVGGLPSRTHVSQGEQRSLALALRLAAHQLATERLGSAPVLLLDDVFSELDPFRSSSLLAGLPPGQALLTTAQAAPPGVDAARVYTLEVDGHTSAVARRDLS